MNKSAWNQKLWVEKLSKLPVKKNANVSWSKMEQLLNQQLPLADPSSTAAAATKTVLSKLTSFITFALPIAVVVSATAYFVNFDGVTVKPKTIVTRKQVKFPVDSLNQFMASTTHLDTPNGSDISGLASPDSSVQPTVLAHQIPAQDKEGTNDVLGKNYSPDPAATVRKEQNSITEQAVSGQRDTGMLTNGNVQTVPESANVAGPAHLLEEDSRPIVKDRSKKVKLKKIRDKKIRQPKAQPIAWPLQPGFQYGLSAGWNGNKSSYYMGAYGNWQLSAKFAVKAGMNYNQGIVSSGDFNDVNYKALDTVTKLSFHLSQKVKTIELPIAVNYRVGKRLSVMAGPVVSIPVSRSAIKLSKLTKSVDSVNTDSLMNSTISRTATGKVNFGLRTGVSYHMRQISFDVGVQWLSPNRFENNLGVSKKVNTRFQIGVSYQFK